MSDNKNTAAFFNGIGQKPTRTSQFERWYSRSADFKMMSRLDGVPSVLLARSMARS